MVHSRDSQLQQNSPWVAYAVALAADGQAHLRAPPISPQILLTGLFAWRCWPASAASMAIALAGVTMAEFVLAVLLLLLLLLLLLNSVAQPLMILLQLEL